MIDPADNLVPRRLVSGRQKLAAYAPGRTCGVRECATVLSIYNPATVCALHEPKTPDPGPGPGKRSVKSAASTKLIRRFAGTQEASRRQGQPSAASRPLTGGSRSR